MEISIYAMMIIFGLGVIGVIMAVKKHYMNHHKNDKTLQ